MAIDIYLDAPARNFCAFERPAVVGGNQVPTYFSRLDDSDLHGQIILGTYPDGYVVMSGDYLQFDIRAEYAPAATYKFGVDLKFLGGPYLSDRDTLDTNGNKSADEDRSPFFDEWYHADVSLESFVGMTLDKLIAFNDTDDPGEYRFALRGIFLTNGDTVQKVLFDGAQTGYLTPTEGISYASPTPISINVSVLDDGGPINYGIPREVLTGTSESISADDLIVINRSTTGNMTFNLVDAGTIPLGKPYIFINAHASNTLTINPFSTQTIDPGALTELVLAAGEFCEIVRILGPGWGRIG